ncbi:MAG TPA: sigma-54 dependent transcriptional regulator [Acidobacteriaceae bacterium]|jgi:transcriptional regulator with PAS, ATPase and Fis domain|nr:sigma-54 dependent transcriptional regulator [Acidobacteriaceae bacterium]
MATSSLPAERYEDRLPIDVFVVSPNARLRQDLQEKLQLPRWNVQQAISGAGALDLLRRHGTQEGVLLLDPQLPDLEPNGFNAIVRDRFPRTQVMMLNSHTGQLLMGSASPTPVSAWLADVVNCTGTETASSVPAVVVETPRSSADGHIRLRSMIGDSEPMQRMYAVTRRVAPRNTTVLITGESGTGKDLLAQEIHLVSLRRNQPFVVVNCSAIPETLLEAELFGYTKGSFTGAVQSRIGRIHAAHGGSLFLDEIGDMPLSLQSKILRFLEQGEVQRLGGNDNLKVDVRVVAATNADLRKKVAEREFREDLYYRLAVFPIHLPPLRERMGDLEELVTAFAARFRPGIGVSPAAMEILRQHRWPGNVRELRNVIERATILADGEREIKAEHIFL